MQQMTYRHSRTRDKNFGFGLASLQLFINIATFLPLKKKNCKWEAYLSNSKPVSEVSGVGQGRGEAHHSDALGGVGGDEVGPGHDDLQHWTPVLTWNTVQTPHTCGLLVCEGGPRAEANVVCGGPWCGTELKSLKSTPMAT